MHVRFALLVVLFLSSIPAQADVYARIDAAGHAEFRNAPADGFELYMKSAPGPAAEAAAPAPITAWDENTPYAKHVRAAAQANNLRPELIHAVISVESNYRPGARSPAGAVGLMQLMPGTAARYNVKNRLDPQQSIRGGARYLRDLMDLFGNNLSLVLAAYNAGEHAVIRHGNRVPPYGETRAYVPRVLARFDLLSIASGAGLPVPAADTGLRRVLPQARVARVFQAPPEGSFALD
jgi:soluble lytic murein transglycosylase-like protein